MSQAEIDSIRHLDGILRELKRALTGLYNVRHNIVRTGGWDPEEVEKGLMHIEECTGWICDYGKMIDVKN